LIPEWFNIAVPYRTAGFLLTSQLKSNTTMIGKYSL